MIKRLQKIIQFVVFFIVCCSFVNVWAQAPQKISYQAVIRNSSNALVINQAVGIKISILQNSADGNAVYIESHSASTNTNGLVSLEIGFGSPILGSFDTINWEMGPYFIKTETDPAGGTNYSIVATSQLMSVPFALFAAKSGEVTNTNFKFFYADKDGDGFGDKWNVVYADAPPHSGYILNSDDCDDSDSAVNPGAEEIPDDDIDQNCDGVKLYLDKDADGFTSDTDCNDEDATVNPGIEEICWNGIDDDCDGGVDEDCVLDCRVELIKLFDCINQQCNGTPDPTCLQNSCSDYLVNIGSCIDINCVINIDWSWTSEEKADYLLAHCGITDNDGDGFTGANGDCDDNNANIYPGATDICDDGIDQDCNGSDKLCGDNDDDGYVGVESGGNDCDDSDPNIYPGAIEFCDGVDNDCDGVVDNINFESGYYGDEIIWYRDQDNDGYGTINDIKYSCNSIEGYVQFNNGDCDDTNASIHPGAIDICMDGIDQDCNGWDKLCNDEDDDKYIASEFGGEDCDDNNPSINPGVIEVCDGIDNNCDGEIDNVNEETQNEGMEVAWYRDEDGDGWGTTTDIKYSCNPIDGYILGNGGDCNDKDEKIHPGAEDICGDGIDQDCNGTDRLCNDNDDDGHVSAGAGGDDCDDLNSNIYPGATEYCDGMDNDCDGVIDNIKDTDFDITYYRDQDGDGFGSTTDIKYSCNPIDGYIFGITGDCNDTDASIHPEAEDICGDGIDQDCNGSDRLCNDNDNDGYVAVEHGGNDCDDSNPNVNPGATEVCGNGVDEDCNGTVDDASSQTDFYKDVDGDGYGNINEKYTACYAPTGFVSNGTDCDDTNASIHPNAVEICGNGKDDDCDGVVDNTILNKYYQDADGDGYGNVNVKLEACSAPTGYVINANDCDDSNKDIHPGPEDCSNGIDDNCNGLIDEGKISTYYQDSDSDGYGNPSVSVQACKAPTGYVESSNDCDDSNPAIHPGDEICDNNIDDNCNGDIDEGCVDADGDGYRQNADCDDTDASIFPGAVEYCDGKDNNCDGLIDEVCVDADGDGYPYTIDCNDTDGNVYPGANELCDGVDNNCDGQVDEGCNDADGDGFIGEEDCDDTDGSVHPGANELCDGIDNNCDGQVDEGCVDADGDGYPNDVDCDDTNSSIYPDAPELCDGKDNNCNGQVDEGCVDADGDGYVVGVDCDDTNGTIHPNANEVEDGKDNDCDGLVDEKTIFYQDLDGDGWGNTNVGILAYVAPAGYVINKGDCNDSVPLINPGKPEICGNGIDDNCNGLVDDCAP